MFHLCANFLVKKVVDTQQLWGCRTSSDTTNIHAKFVWLFDKLMKIGSILATLWTINIPVYTKKSRKTFLSNASALYSRPFDCFLAKKGVKYTKWLLKMTKHEVLCSSETFLYWKSSKNFILNSFQALRNYSKWKNLIISHK
jgi:hypothetical protein